LVKPSGARSWVLRVQHAGRRQDIGLGSDADLTLEEAREKAAKLRKVARQGMDARAVRDRKKVEPLSFAQVVEKAHAELGKGWSDKTAEAFLTSLQAHAFPTIGRRRVAEIRTGDLLEVLAPIWTTKPEQARKVRHRMLQVLAFAKANEWRAEPVPTPAELRKGLAKQPKSTGFRAVPFAEVPAVIAGELAKPESPARLALLFTVLTAARSGEVRGAQWEHIDREARTWARPAETMKSDKPHVVTLNAEALAILDRAAALWGDAGLVFPSSKGLLLSDAALGKILRMAGRAETVHGFRSSFRDWAAEKMSGVPAMVAEMALAHSVGTSTEQAYLRSDLRDLRFTLLDAWGRFAAPSLGHGEDNVIKLGAA
jgi:integrase